MNSILCGFQRRYVERILDAMPEQNFVCLIVQPDSVKHLKKLYQDKFIVDRNLIRLGQGLSFFAADELAYCDKALMKKFEPFLEQTLRMFSRMDPKSILTYEERIQQVYKMLGVFNRFVQENDITSYISREIPHFPAEYILARCVEINGGRFFTSEFIEYVEKRRTLTSIDNKILFNPKDIKPNKDKSKIQDAFEKIRNKTYKESQATSIKELLDKNQNSILSELRAILYFVGYSFAFWKGRSSNISVILSGKSKTDYPSRMQVGCFFYRLRWKTAKLEKFYRQLTSDFLLPKKFVYFAPNYQPEATTLPDGDGMHDIVNLVKMISQALPANTKLVYKEHPVTFNRPYKTLFRGAFARSEHFWSELSEIPNVVLAPIHFDTFQLIDESDFVSAIVGSVLVEAGVRGKNCIMFGNSWHEYLTHVVKIHDEGQLSDLISRKFYKRKVDLEELYKQFDVIDRSCYPLDLYDLQDSAQKTETDIEDEVEKFCNDIEKSYSRI